MIRWLSCLLLVALPALAAPTPIGNYADLQAALEQGRAVRAVIHYGECKLLVDGKEETAPAAIGGMNLWPFEAFPANLFGNPKGFLATSTTNLISHRKYGHVYNYVKLKIFDDGTVEITARYLKPKNLKIVMDETFTGRLSTTPGEGGIYLFAGE